MDFSELFLRTPAVFIHFVLASLSLVYILSLDLKFLLGASKPLTESLLDDLKWTEMLIGWTLAFLYASGLYLILAGYFQDGGYLANEKLHFKVLVVFLLTLSGLCLTLMSRTFKIGDIVSKYPWWKKHPLRLAGVISSASWFWAAFLGTAKSWSFTISLGSMALWYFCSIILVYLTVTIFISVTKNMDW